MKLLILMRGVTGCGKSTKARALVEEYKTLYGADAVIFSTDDFYVRDGEYKWNPAAIGHAHCWNQLRAIQAMIDNWEVVIIDNTNTQAWEARPYVQAAVKLGYDVEIVEPSTPWAFDADELAKKTTHGVPLETVRAMIARYERDLTVEKILAAESRERK